MTNERAASVWSGLFGIALAACIALPLDPDSGESALSMLLQAFEEDWLGGIVMTLLIAPPYAIGLCVGLATFTRLGTTLVKVPLVLLHLEVLLFALFIFHGDDGKARLALLGFSVVMVLRLLARAAASRSRGTHASLGWLARSGGILVAGFYGWMRLQMPSEAIGIGLTATIVAAALMAAAARTRDAA